MKNLYFIIIFILFLNIHKASSQHITVGYSAGYATYKMDDMKRILDETLKTLPVDGKIINNFPGYFNQTIQAGYSIKEHDFGMQYGLMSTGGKISYGDYSGSLYDKMDAKANSLGLYYKYHFYNQKMGKNWLSFFAAVSPGIIFSKMDLEENIHLNASPTDQNDKATFESTNIYVEPQFGFSFRFLNYFAVQLSVGYNFGINQEMKGKSGYFTDNYGNQTPINGLETNSKIDWSGLRANVGITLFLPSKKMN